MMCLCDCHGDGLRNIALLSGQLVTKSWLRFLNQIVFTKSILKIKTSDFFLNWGGCFLMK